MNSPNHESRSIMINYVLILFASFLFTLNLNAQTLEYNIASQNSHIGQLSISKTQEKDSIKIKIHGEVNAHLFISIQLEYHLVANYKNDSLIFSSVTTYVNGKLHSSCTTEKTADYYSLTRDDNLSKLHYQILYSGALLYWKEPGSFATVYSEFDGIEKPIKKVGPNKYQLTNPKTGNLSTYYYNNGILDKAIIEHTLTSFTLTKR